MAQKTCLSQYKYVGGVHQRSKSIWEILEEHNIKYDDVDMDWPRYVTWDIEAKAVPIDTTMDTEKR